MSPSESPCPAELVMTTIADGDVMAETTASRRQADALLTKAVGIDRADDRFKPVDQTDKREVLALAHLDGQPVVYVAAAESRGRLQFDTVADLNALGVNDVLSPEDTERNAVDIAVSLIDQAAATHQSRFGSEHDAPLITEVWGRPRQNWHHALAHRLNLAPHRTLLQMRCRLPLAHDSLSPLPTRSIDIDRDGAELVAVNNRAFSYHPDQSNQQPADVVAQFGADGFDVNSVRILDAADLPDLDPVEGRPMAGFCWTKLHESRAERPALGEIYVIAVDPGYHGHRLGLGLTAAGLNWMADQALTVGMLYVESDNEPAVRTYRKLGFEIHAEYTAWRATEDTGVRT